MRVSVAGSGFATHWGRSAERASKMAAVALPLLNLLGKAIALV